MKLSKKQKVALEKNTGRAWDRWHPLAIEGYFALTDRGQCVVIPAEARSDYLELMEYHRQHPIIVEMWKQDFKKGYLFLWDFLQPDYPASYIKHAFDIYEGVMGYIPKCYREHPLAPKQ